MSTNNYEVTSGDIRKGVRESGLDNVFKEAKKHGNDSDQIPYHDPAGFLQTSGSGWTLKQKMFDGGESGGGYADFFTTFNQNVSKMGDLQEALRETRKNFNTTDVALPIYVSPNTYVSDSEDLPLADLLPRVATSSKDVYANELNNVGIAQAFNEPGTNSGTDEDYANVDDGFAEHAYTVGGYGRKTSVSDLVQIAGRTASPMATTEMAQVAGQRMFEERQIIQGNDATAGYDSGGFKGFNDLVLAGNDVDASTYTDTSLNLEKVREALTALEKEGAKPGSVIHITGHDEFAQLKADIQQYVKYDTSVTVGDDVLEAGFKGIDVDGSVVLKSHGVPAGEFWSFDASAFWLAMARDATLIPLAKNGPQDTIATDSYGTLVSAAPSRLHAFRNIA